MSNPSARLKVLCPQLYDGATMRVTPCQRCASGWDRNLKRCVVDTGAEAFELVAPADVPTCPIQDRCQHQIQQAEPCAVRSRGMICESALVFSGVPREDATERADAFNAIYL